MATINKKSKENAETAQRHKILRAGLDLQDALESIVLKHRLTPADLAEVLKYSFDNCFRFLLKKHRSKFPFGSI